MKNQKETIRKMVGYLNNPEKDGGFWLPNIQRNFVWDEGQIERLFDSIMREYPIGTLLIWKTKSKIRKRKFVDNYRHGLKIIDSYIPEDDKMKMLILDGQQRLQSLFIGLKGNFEKKDLYFDILSGEAATLEEIKYRFKFIESENAGLPWVKFKDIVFSDKRYNQIANDIVNSFSEKPSAEEQQIIDNNVAQIVKVFSVEENIVYQEIDSIDRPELYKEDDVVEIFIRANSGGTPLSKSDLLFSLLIVSWEDADEKMEELLDELNKVGFGFDRDFILKTCLTIVGKGAAYNVAKFRDEKTKEIIIFSWEQISDSIKDVKDYLWGKTYVRSDKALPSYLVLIPLIYFRHYYKKEWNSIQNVDDYILRTLISGAFSGGPDVLIDKCVEEINKSKSFIINDIYNVIRTNGRSLEITKETIFEQCYGYKSIHLFFNLWYKNFNYQPSFQNNNPQVDHIFLQSELKKIKINNPTTGRKDMLKYRQEDRDQIANLMLLSQEENGRGGKTDILPEKWFEDKPNEYLDMHLIPKDKQLWKLENFELFIEKRKELIEKKFDYLILKK